LVNALGGEGSTFVSRYYECSETIEAKALAEAIDALIQRRIAEARTQQRP